MKRRWRSMRKFKQQFLAGPYLIWIIGFILLPLIMILYYAFTNGDGSFTLSYITAIADETNRKAMGLSLRLGIICTIVCLVLSYPLAMILNNMKIKNQGLVVFIFMLPMWMNFLLLRFDLIMRGLYRFLENIKVKLLTQKCRL